MKDTNQKDTMTMTMTTMTTKRSVRRNIFTVTALLCFTVGLALLADAGTDNKNSHDTTARPNQLQLRRLKEDDHDRVGSLDLDIDPDVLALIAGIVLIPIAAIGAAATAVTGGALLLDRDNHKIPSRLEYTLPTSVVLRDLSSTEQDDFMEVTTTFYTDLLTAAYPDDFKRIKLVSKRDAKDSTASNFIVEFLDRITGNARNYGYEWEFNAIIGVEDTDTLTKGQLLTTLQGADMAAYVTNFLVPLPSSNILSSTDTVAYLDRL